MKKAIRMSVLIFALFATLTAVATPVSDGLPRPDGRYTVGAPGQHSLPDGLPRPDGR